MPRKRAQLIGVTGSMQSGKQELLHVYRQLGWTTFDLNHFADGFRAEGGPGRPLYDTLELSVGLNPDGTEKGILYQKLYRHPHLGPLVVEPEVNYVTAQLHARLPLPEGVTVASWGYVYKMLNRDLPFDHVLFFQSSREAWLGRLHRRVQELAGQDFTDQELLDIAKVVDMMPEPIEQTVRTSGVPYTIIDTSPSDWGEANLVRALHDLGLT